MEGASIRERFRDLLRERREESSNFMWVSRELHPLVACERNVKPKPADVKRWTVESPRVCELLEKLSDELNVSRQTLEQQARSIVDEIGYSKHLTLIRWLGLLLTKICLRVCTGIYVDEQSVSRVKSMMGSTPTLFLPSHRSYADFILMSYVCFAYDIEIPAIASGMDFHAMWGMGSMLRETGAFFMHRSYDGDDLYWEVFAEYVRQLVTVGDLPVEFFIEGTRSRSCKSLAPKTGLLSMLLRAFFSGEVADVLLVPINISYDRVMEERLFAYELLGVPKPKESTSAFFKSLGLIKENYGNIYVSFAEPISAREFFAEISKPPHAGAPGVGEDKRATSTLAREIVRAQQKRCVITAANLTAVVVTGNLMSGAPPLTVQELIDEVANLKRVFTEFGAPIDVASSPSGDVRSALKVHANLLKIDKDGAVGLVWNEAFRKNAAARLKGHDLSEKTMVRAVPFMMLQLYVNPTLHYLIDAAVVVVVLRRRRDGGALSRSELRDEHRFLRSTFAHEFVYADGSLTCAFEESLLHLAALDVIEFDDGGGVALKKGEKKTSPLLALLLDPFLRSYHEVCRVLHEGGPGEHEERRLLAATQARLELALNGGDETFLHPYSLSLDTLGNCLSCLADFGAIVRSRRGSGGVFYQVDGASLSELSAKLALYLPKKPVAKTNRTPSIALKNKL